MKIKKKKEKHVFMCFFCFVFIFLRTKALKRIQNSLYEKKYLFIFFYKRVYFEIFFSLLNNKTLKCMQFTLFGATKRHYQKRVIEVFLSILTIKR